MAAGDARPVPRKNVAFRHYFAIRKNDGTLITTWAGMDSEVDKDGAGFADCTNEATEIGTSGVGYIDLTSTEMNADAVNLKVTVTNTGALPIVVTFFPEESGDYRSDVVQWLGTAAATPTVAGVPEVDATHWRGTAVPAEHTAGYPVVTVKDGTGTGEINTNAGAIALVDVLTTYTGNTVQTGDAFGRIGLAGVGLSNVPWNASWDTEVQSEVNDGLVAFFGSVAAIVDAVWDEVLGGHLTAGTTGAGLNAAGSAGDPWSTALPGAYGAGTAGKIVGDNVNATISSRSSHSAADIWAVGTRVLTAGTNIVLAKGTGVTGFTDISAAQVNTEVDTALSDVGLTTTITGRIDAAISTRSSHAAADVWSVGTRTITGGTVSTNSDKTGYALSSSGLDSISVTAPAGVASTFPSMVVQVWRRFFKKATKSATEIVTYADNGSTVVTTQVISAVGDDETQGAAT